MARSRSINLIVPALLGLFGCDLPLPAGNYTPEDLDKMMGIGDAGRGDAMVVLPPTPGGAQGGAGGTVGGTVGGTAGGAAGGGEGGGNPDDARLQALAGQYLMRMDMLSTASVQVLPAVRVGTRNRISYLLVTEIYVEAGQLKSNERLCHQLFAHTCTEGCSTLSTTTYPAVTDKLVEAPFSQRSYALTATDLTGNTLRMNLGFDASSNEALPTSSSDARVWDIVSGNGDREGMMARLDSKGLFSVSCDVYSVQSFVSKITGKLGGTSSAPTLVGQTFKLDTSGADAKSLGASDSKCTDDGKNPPTQGEQTVRFASASEIDRTALFSCPEPSAWEKAGLTTSAP